jgi:hypothetical protein
MKIVVIRGTGLIGSKLVTAFGHKVTWPMRLRDQFRGMARPACRRTHYPRDQRVQRW